VDSLWGIVNATCNFIMTRLEQGDLTVEDAIADAQRLGFAEADPSADLDGRDAAAKLSILAYRAFGTWVRPGDFLVRGIRDIDPVDCDLAESMGFRIRQIARAVRRHGTLDMAVEPLLLPSWHLLASVEEEYNAVYLRCVSSGDLSLFGKGAGSLPTATAILGDLIDLAQDNSVRWPVPHALPVAGEDGGAAPAARRHYLRVSGQAHPGLERKFEGLVRRLGLIVQNRASRVDQDRIHIAFMVSPGSDVQMADVSSAIGHLARVEQRLCLGVMD
jgi:homoserine dehydrogenase